MRSRFANPGLFNGGARITFGGEIVNNQSGGNHTTTDMGSGAFPSSGFGFAAYQRNMSFYQGLTVPTLTQVSGFSVTTGTSCYDILPLTASDWGRYIYFGGTGYSSPNCT